MRVLTSEPRVERSHTQLLTHTNKHEKRVRQPFGQLPSRHRHRQSSFLIPQPKELRFNISSLSRRARPHTSTRTESMLLLLSHYRHHHPIEFVRHATLATRTARRTVAERRRRNEVGARATLGSRKCFCVRNSRKSARN